MVKPIYNLTPYAQIAHHGTGHPDKLAVKCAGIELTWGLLYDRVKNVAAYLTKKGIGFNERVIVCNEKKVDFIVSVFGVMAAGGIPVPVAMEANGMLEHVINDCCPKFIIGLESDPVKISSNIICIDLSEVNKRKDNFKGKTIYEKDEIAILFYTSGTTSSPKGVMVTYANLSATVNYINTFMGIDEKIVEYMVAPVNHAFGFGRVRSVIAAGGTMIFDEGVFNPAKVILSIKQLYCNAISSVSAGFILLLDNFSRYLHEVGGQINWIEIGSMPLDAVHKKMMLEYFHEAKVVMNYGLTEGMRSTLFDLKRSAEKLESVGQASPGNEIAIIDEKGNKVPSGHEGEISIKGPHLAKGYWKRKNEWEKKIINGWFLTGDIGFLDKDNYLYFLGREDDVINVGGEKLLPLVIEEKLKKKLGNTNYCILGLPDSAGILGEIPVLCIEGSEKPELKRINSALGSIDSKFYPRKVINVKSFPRTRNGKIIKRKLKMTLTKENI